jgi:hypothetical protein
VSFIFRIANGLSGLEPQHESRLAPIQEDTIVDDPTNDITMYDTEPKDHNDVDFQLIDNANEGQCIFKFLF